MLLFEVSVKQAVQNPRGCKALRLTLMSGAITSLQWIKDAMQSRIRHFQKGSLYPIGCLAVMLRLPAEWLAFTPQHFTFVWSHCPKAYHPSIGATRIHFQMPLPRNNRIIWKYLLQAAQAAGCPANVPTNMLCGHSIGKRKITLHFASTNLNLDA